MKWFDWGQIAFLDDKKRPAWKIFLWRLWWSWGTRRFRYNVARIFWFIGVHIFNPVGIGQTTIARFYRKSEDRWWVEFRYPNTDLPVMVDSFVISLETLEQLIERSKESWNETESEE